MPGLLVTAVYHLSLITVMLTMVSGIAVTTPPTTSLALADYPEMAGTASSLLGVARPLGLVTVVSIVLAVAASMGFIHRRPATTLHRVA